MITEYVYCTLQALSVKLNNPQMGTETDQKGHGYSNMIDKLN